MMADRSFPDEKLIRRFAPFTALQKRVHLRPAMLARREALALGNSRLLPATRRLEGPAATVTLEPRVLQVLLALADAGGDVLTRDELIDQCWNGQVVGEDSLNRAIAELRRALRTASADLTVETISKVGYRLDVPAAPAAAPPTRRVPSRRQVAVGASALVAAAAAGVYGFEHGRHRDPRVLQLLGRAREAMRDKLPDSMQQGVGFLREAVALAPDDADAWGMLAMAWYQTAEFAPQPGIEQAVRACESAVRRALELDPDQADALAAQALLPPMFGDWFAAERRLDAVLRRHPDQMDVLDGKGVLLFSVGRTAAAADIIERLAQMDPLSPVFQFRRTYRLWTAGDLAAADRTIDRALQLWPRYPAIWYARFLLFALTGRVEAAQALLRGSPTAPPVLSADDLGGWSATLTALRSGKASDRDKAVAASVASARTFGMCTNAILSLAALGALDRAFDVAYAYLLDRGPLAAAIDRGSPGRAINDQRWRKTMMLFIPATAAMRADPRFAGLCRDLGMADYWRRMGVGPDYLAEQSGP
jgi:DNA-binding winged helix-turn-helix (wHTH) protein/Flp pilus assembly protein TadD